MAAPTDDYVRGMAAEMIDALSTSLQENEHHGLIRRYLAGEHDLPYVPNYARREYRASAAKAITNWLPLLPATFSKALWVDDYRRSNSANSAKPWKYWQGNGLDARQSVAHKGALEYGASYTLVLPGKPVPLIRPLSPLRSMAFYEDQDDEYPVQAIFRAGTTVDKKEIWRAYDAERIYTLLKGVSASDKLEIHSVEEHPLGVTPWVRFRSQLDDDARGIVYPNIVLQDRINEAVFTLLIAIQYGSFRQRWAKGLSIQVDDRPTMPDPQDPENEIPNPNFGMPIESFDVAADRLWVSDSPDAQFGEFSQTDTDKHLKAYESAVQTLLALSDVPPDVLRGEIVNVSADALASIYDSTERQADVFRTLFGESWEQAFRLAAKADGDNRGANDTSAQVRWRDTKVRSLGALVDAITKMVQTAELPHEAAWEMWPGVTQETLGRWHDMRETQRADEEARQAKALAQQAEVLQTSGAADEAPPQEPAPAPAPK